MYLYYLFTGGKPFFAEGEYVVDCQLCIFDSPPPPLQMADMDTICKHIAMYMDDEVTRWLMDQPKTTLTVIN